MQIMYPKDIPEEDKKVLDKFAKEEYKKIPARPIPSVIELPNRHRYSYTPSYSEAFQDYLFSFEEIKKWNS